jgi:SRSO17 transposase
MPKGSGTSSLDAATMAVLSAGREEFEALCQRVERRIRRWEVRQRLRGYLAALLAPVARRNGWQLAEQLGETTPDGVQRLLNAARWDADAVRDDLRDYVVEQLGDPEAVLVVDETGFLKKGTHSVGVKRQYSGTAGRIENCQVGVFLAYASPRGRTFLDRELYLPKEWAEDEERRAQAGVPENVRFATKPQLARTMLERALDAGVPVSWVTADSIYGSDRRLRRWLEERQQPFVLAVGSHEYLWVATKWYPVQVAATELVDGAPAGAWERHSAGAGAKGPRLYDWLLLPLLQRSGTHWQHALLARRSLKDPTALAYYVVFAPREASLAELVRVAGTRWAIEECLESAKGEVGLDQYEVRRWEAWYRYVTIALLAHAYLAVLKSRASSRPKGGGPSDESTGNRAGPRTAAADPAGSTAPTAGAGLEHRSAAGTRAPLVVVAAKTSSQGQALPLSASPGL